MNKIKGSDLDKQAQELHESGQMPELEKVLQAVSEAREKYRDKILAARQQTNPGAEALKQK